jgi:hypothetical protein
MRKQTPADYHQKFAGFICACEKAQAEKAPNIIIAQPQVLGDTYDEVMESLRRLADARLALLIAGE